MLKMSKMSNVPLDFLTLLPWQGSICSLRSQNGEERQWNCARNSLGLRSSFTVAADWILILLVILKSWICENADNESTYYKANHVWFEVLTAVGTLIPVCMVLKPRRQGTWTRITFMPVRHIVLLCSKDSQETEMAWACIYIWKKRNDYRKWREHLIINAYCKGDKEVGRQNAIEIKRLRWLELHGSGLGSYPVVDFGIE
jgi:hypothetical protein